MLLGSPADPLQTGYPSPLEWLTVRLSDLSWAECIVKHPKPIKFEDMRIQAVQLTSESMECLVVLKSGHSFVYQFSKQERPKGPSAKSQGEAMDLRHIPARADQFHPLLLVDNTRGSVTAYDLSNIGKSH